MTIREYIADKNLPGVARWAYENGMQVPQNKQQAYGLLDGLYRSDPSSALSIFAQLHPDRDIMQGANPAGMMNGVAIKPGYRNCCGHSADGTPTSCGCDKCSRARNFYNADGDSGTQSAISRGMAATETAVKESVRDIREAFRDQDRRLLTYGIIFIGGVLVGKYLLSK